jgi:hypothetical protein
MAWASTSTCKRCVRRSSRTRRGLVLPRPWDRRRRVGVMFGAEAFDDIGGCGFAVGSRRMNEFPRMRFLRSMSTAISPGLGLPAARAFVSEADIFIGEAGESCGRSGVLGLGVGRMGCANDDGHCLLSSGVVSGPGPDFVLNLCPSARPGRGGGKINRCGWCGRSEASHGRVDFSCGEGGEEPLVSP